jgi:hypothetical protein
MVGGNLHGEMKVLPMTLSLRVAKGQLSTPWSLLDLSSSNLAFHSKDEQMEPVQDSPLKVPCKSVGTNHKV